MPFVERLSLGGFRGIQADPPLNLKFSKLTILIGPNATSKSSVLEFLYGLWDPPWSIKDTYKELGKVRAKLLIRNEEIDVNVLERVVRKSFSSVLKELSEEVLNQESLDKEEWELLKKIILSFAGNKFKRREFDEELIKSIVKDMKNFEETLRNIFELIAESSKNEKAWMLFFGSKLFREGSCVETLSSAFSNILKRVEIITTSFLEETIEWKVDVTQSEVFDEIAERLVQECNHVLSFSKKDEEEFGDAFVALIKEIFKRTVNEILTNSIFYLPSYRANLCTHAEKRVDSSLKKALLRIASSSYDPELYSEALRYLREISGVSRVRALQTSKGVKIDLYDSYSAEWVSLSRSAFGSCTSLFVVLLLATLSDNKVVLIDDIEMGLHPSAQIKLIDYIIKVLKKLDLQVVFTTHSGVVFDYILYKVLKGELNEEDVAINFLYRDTDAGVVKSKFLRAKLPLELDEELKRALEQFGSSGIFSEQHDIDWQITMSLARGSKE